MQCPGDGRRGQRQNIDLLAHLLEQLLVGHPKTLLFVDDEQAQILELHILRQEPVRPNHNVYAALGQEIHHPLLLLAGEKTREHFHRDRKRSQPLGEGLEMLLGQHRSRHQDRHLLAVHDRLERGPQRYLRLAIAHIAADQPVHGPRLFHIHLDLFQSA